MIKKPPSLSYSPFEPPRWQVSQTLKSRSDSASEIASEMGLSFGHVVSAVIGDEGCEEVVLRWPVSAPGPLAVVLFDRSSKPIDAFVLPHQMVEKTAVREGAEWVYSLLPRRRHHVAVLEEIARLDETTPA